MYVLLLIFLFTIIEAFGLYNIKLFSIKDGSSHLIAAIICYAIVAYLFSKAVKVEKVGIVNHEWNIFSSLFGLIIGWMAFSETVTMTQLGGVGLSLIGMILINK